MSTPPILTTLGVIAVILIGVLIFVERARRLVADFFRWVFGLTDPIVRYVERRRRERAFEEHDETLADRAARLTANATVWMAIFTLFLTLTNVFTVLILRNQLREMHEGGIDTHALAQAASDQADAAQQFSDTANDISGSISDAVDQLQSAADNAKASIRATQNAMRLDQRAWLGTSDYTYTIAETAPVDSVAMVLNTGRTPAMDIRCRITGTTRMKGDVLHDSDIVYPAELPILKQGTLFPNQHFPLKAAGPPMEPDKQKIWAANVQNGKWVQYFFGEVRYKDVFRIEHWTHFCTQFVRLHPSDETVFNGHTCCRSIIPISPREAGDLGKGATSPPSQESFARGFLML